MCESNHYFPAPKMSFLQRWRYFLCRNAWWQDNTHKCLQGKSHLRVRKIICLVGIMKSCNKLSREVVKSLSLEIAKTFDKTMDNLI